LLAVICKTCYFKSSLSALGYPPLPPSGLTLINVDQYITSGFYESHEWAVKWDPEGISPNQTSNLEQTKEVIHKEAAKNITTFFKFSSLH